MFVFRKLRFSQQLPSWENLELIRSAFHTSWRKYKPFERFVFCTFCPLVPGFSNFSNSRWWQNSHVFWWTCVVMLPTNVIQWWSISSLSLVGPIFLRKSNIWERFVFFVYFFLHSLQQINWKFDFFCFGKLRKKIAKTKTLSIWSWKRFMGQSENPYSALVYNINQKKLYNE